MDELEPSADATVHGDGKFDAQNSIDIAAHGGHQAASIRGAQQRVRPRSAALLGVPVGLGNGKPSGNYMPWGESVRDATLKF